MEGLSLQESLWSEQLSSFTRAKVVGPRNVDGGKGEAKNELTSNSTRDCTDLSQLGRVGAGMPRAHHVGTLSGLRAAVT